MLLSIDALRFDAISAETNKTYLQRFSFAHAPDTPHMDRFAREGVRFSECRTASAFTSASHASMLTGQNPYRHGIRQFLQNDLDSRAKTLAERLVGAGFAAFGGLDYPDLLRFNHLTRGIEMLPTRKDDAALAAFETAAKAGKRVFLFLHSGDVHPPYGQTFCPETEEDNRDVPGDYIRLAEKLGLGLSEQELELVRTSPEALTGLSNRVRRWSVENDWAAGIALPRYLAGVNRFDRLRFARFFGRLEARGLLDDTLVVVTADHGHTLIESDQMALEEGKPLRRKFDHGETVAEEVIRIPWIVWSKAPTIRPRAWDMPVSSIDIAPTMLALLGVPFKPEDMDGTSRSALIDANGGTGEDWHRAQTPSDCYTEAWYHKRTALSDYMSRSLKAGKLLPETYPTHLHQRSVRSGRYKFVETAGRRDAFYDTFSDPWERCNLLDYSPFFGKWDFLPDYGQIARPLIERLHNLAGDTIPLRQDSVASG